MNNPVLDTSPGEAATLFDRVLIGDRQAAEDYGVSIVALPGEEVPEDLPADTVAITRCLGEGRIAVTRALQSAGDGAGVFALGTRQRGRRPLRHSRRLRR